MKDVDDVFENNQDPEMARYAVGIPPIPITRQMAESLVSMFSNPPESQGILQIFAVVLEGKVIGEICLNQHEPDAQNDRSELTYALAHPHWGKGLTSEAAKAVMDWAFQTHNLHRMYAWCDPHNIGSWRVMEKLGMKREGLLRHHIKWNGEYRDQLYYGILRSEWEKINQSRV
jgi:RimJ/RimL family protein N-acetyltransferase